MKLRIIGGELRGRSIAYHGEPCTRPMKNRVREAVFNLVGPAVSDTLAIDLFAGTGALALEALSRGAAFAVAVERHFPSVKTIRENANSLKVADRIRVVAADVFQWFPAAELDFDRRWIVFCSPPYDFFESQSEPLRHLAAELVRRAPPGSLVVLEGDRRLDASSLPDQADWEVRTYPPAVIALGEV